MFARRTALVALLLCPLQAASAQDHLEPETSLLESIPSSRAYCENLQILILSKIPQHYHARMICTPTFNQPQWVIAVFKDENSKFFVEYFEAKRRIGPEKESREIEVRRIKVEIDRESADALEAVWHRMLQGVRYPDKGRFGDDGDSYSFSRNLQRAGFAEPRGFHEGEIWAPDEESPTGRLVAIGERLRDYALARPEERAGVRTEIRRKSEQLTADLSRPDRKN